MDDDELDALLTRARPALGSETATAARDLATATRPASRGRVARPRRRRRVFWGAAAAGVVLLTAGGTLTAAQLHVPPFQTLEPGVERISTAVPVDYVERSGRPVTCEAFLEFRQLDRSSRDQVTRYLQEQDWTGFGQTAYDTAAARTKSSSEPTTTDVFYEIVDEDLAAAATRALPGVPVNDRHSAGVIFSGSAMSCRPGTR